MGTIQSRGVASKRGPSTKCRKKSSGQESSARPDGGGCSALTKVYGIRRKRANRLIVRRMPPQKASKSQHDTDTTEKTKSKDREWLTTAELATKIGWREHALRDAMRGKDLPGVRRTAFGYHVEASAVDEIKKTLGEAPPKGNSSLKAAVKN